RVAVADRSGRARLGRTPDSERVDEVRVLDAGDEHAADVVAAEWGQDEEGNRQNGDGRLDADLSKGPASVRRVRHAARPPSFFEGDEVEPRQDPRRGGQI